LRAEHEISAGDDLTRIDGLNADHAERLRTAGVTTYAKLAQLSTDELRLITLTPNSAATNYAAWRVAAAQLAADGHEGCH
jgi:predicted flap endonuclease-1-like 5' DNA nuclease